MPNYTQAFIQVVLLMSVFKQRLSFSNIINADGVLQVLQGPQRFYGETLVGVHGVKLIKYFDLFTSGG